MLALIVAFSENRVIGRSGKIPWNIEGEKKRFKELTTGNIIIMGRHTYEEIGFPLPNRETIVVSKTRNFDQEHCITVKSLEEALETAKLKWKNKDIFISGGEKLYKEALPLVEKMYITEIEKVIEGDAYFPIFDETMFEKEKIEYVDGEIPYTYYTYFKK
ncbi:MAG: dihydrofolate reductase [Lachnospiraceae bacterium]